MPEEENIETYADFTAAHKKQYNAKRIIARNKRVELMPKDMPEESRREKGTYVLSQVEPRLIQIVKRLKPGTQKAMHNISVAHSFSHSFDEYGGFTFYMSLIGNLNILQKYWRKNKITIFFSEFS